MEHSDRLPADLQEALQSYLAARRKHEGMRGRKDEFPSTRDWQQAVRSLDVQRREAHNAAAMVVIAYGMSPRLEDEEEALRLGREKVKELLGLI